MGHVAVGVFSASLILVAIIAAIVRTTATVDRETVAFTAMFYVAAFGLAWSVSYLVSQ